MQTTDGNRCGGLCAGFGLGANNIVYGMVYGMSLIVEGAAVGALLTGSHH